jgi:hypothetical protein
LVNGEGDMMKKLLAIILLVFSTQCIAADEWSDVDVAREVAFQTLALVDWGQTADISSRCVDGSVREMNPILGSCPNRGKVNVYFPIAMLAHLGVSSLLSSDARSSWQNVTLVVEGLVVHSNYRIGLKINF